MSIENWYINRRLKGTYKVMSNDRKTSVLGVILAGIIAANVDYAKVMALDPAAVGQLVGAIVTAVLAFYVNRPDAKMPKPQTKP